MVGKLRWTLHWSIMYQVYVYPIYVCLIAQQGMCSAIADESVWCTLWYAELLLIFESPRTQQELNTLPVPNAVARCIVCCSIAYHTLRCKSPAGWFEF